MRGKWSVSKPDSILARNQLDELNRVLARIESGFETDHLPRIQQFMRQPSVSATGEGILETANFVMERLRELGATDVHLVPVPEGEFGHPQVYGELVEDPARP